MPKQFTIIATYRDVDTGVLEIVDQLEFVSKSNEDMFKRDLKDLVDAHAVPDGRKTSSKIVIVLAVDPEITKRFEESVAEARPTNGLYSQRVVVDQEFPSAKAASLHLGLKNNEVALYLNKVSHLGPEERVAKLRGVSLQYQEDYHAGLLANLRD